MFPAEGLQLADDLGLPAQRQVRSGAGLERHEGQLVQMRPLGIGEAGVGEFGQWFTPPQSERFAQRDRCRLHVAILQKPLPFGHQLFKEHGVEVLGLGRRGRSRLRW